MEMRVSDIANILSLDDKVRIKHAEECEATDSIGSSLSSHHHTTIEGQIQPKNLDSSLSLETWREKLLNDQPYGARIGALLHAVLPHYTLRSPSVVQSQIKHTLLRDFNGDDHKYRQHFNDLLERYSSAECLSLRRQTLTNTVEKDVADPTAPWKGPQEIPSYTFLMESMVTPIDCAANETGRKTTTALKEAPKSIDNGALLERQFEMEKELDAAPYYTGMKTTRCGSSGATSTPGSQTAEKNSVPFIPPSWSLRCTREQREALHRIRHTVLSAEVLNSLLDKFSLVEGWKVFFQDVPPETMVECNGTQAGPYRSIIFTPLSLLSMKRCVVESQQRYMQSPVYSAAYCYSDVTMRKAVSYHPSVTGSKEEGIPSETEAGLCCLPLHGQPSSATRAATSGEGWNNSELNASYFPPIDNAAGGGVYTSSHSNSFSSPPPPVSSSSGRGNGTRKRGSNTLESNSLNTLRSSPLPSCAIDLRRFDYCVLTLADLDRMIWHIAANCVLFNAPETCYRATATEFAASCSIIIQDYCIRELYRQNGQFSTNTAASFYT